MAARRQTAPAQGTGPGLGLRRRRPQGHMTEEGATIAPSQIHQAERTVVPAAATRSRTPREVPGELGRSARTVGKTAQLSSDGFVAELLDALIQLTRLRRTLEDRGGELGTHHVQPGGYRVDPLRRRQRQRQLQRCGSGVEGTGPQPDRGQIDAPEPYPTVLSPARTCVVQDNALPDLLSFPPLPQNTGSPTSRTSALAAPPVSPHQPWLVPCPPSPSPPPPSSPPPAPPNHTSLLPAVPLPQHYSRPPPCALPRLPTPHSLNPTYRNPSVI